MKDRFRWCSSTLCFLIIYSLLFSAVLIGASGCQNFRDLPPAEQIAICQDALEVMAKPECLRLASRGDRYVDLCNRVVDDAIAACESGIRKDPVLMCDRIKDKVKDCQWIPDGSAQREANVATCERVILGASLLCRVGLMDPEKAAERPAEPDGEDTAAPSSPSEFDPSLWLEVGDADRSCAYTHPALE